LSEWAPLSDPSKAKWLVSASGIPLPTQQCEIMNDGGAPILSIEMQLPVQFQEALSDKDQPGVTRSGSVTRAEPWFIYVPRIDPGTDRAFSFYVWNNSEQFAQVAFPDSAVGQVLGENQRRSIKVIHSRTMPMFFSLFVEAKQDASATKP
jgi:hypothetical protein